MIIYLLIVTCIFLIFIAYIFSSEDIMSPSVLLGLGYLIATISCAMNIERWNVDLHENTYILIVTGIVSFLITEILFRYLKYKKGDNNYKKEKKYELREIIIPNIIIALCIIFNIIVGILYLKEIMRISGGYNGDFSQMMNKYRKAYSYDSVAVKSYVIQLMKFAKGIGYTFLFVFFNNIFAQNNKNIKSSIKYLLPSIIYLLDTFLIGGRLNFIIFSVACIFFIFYNWNRKYSWKKKISGKFIKIICISFAIFLVIFYNTKSIVGRTSQRNFFYYITEYLGGSIQLLDEYLNQNNTTKGGIETFPGIVQSLNKLHIIDTSAEKSLEFRHVIDGMYLGNIYTGLRRYYSDFGYIGVIFMQIIFSLIFNELYYKIKNDQKNNSLSIFRVIFYSYSLFSILTQAMEDHFFIDLSFGFFVEMIIIYFTIRIITNKKYLRGNEG